MKKNTEDPKKKYVELGDWVRRINKAVNYKGNEDHEDVRSILKHFQETILLINKNQYKNMNKNMTENIANVTKGKLNVSAETTDLLLSIVITLQVLGLFL